MTSRTPMRVMTTIALLALVSGCASSKVQGKRTFTSGQTMSRPSRVLVYDFRANLPKVQSDDRREQQDLFEESRDALAEQLVARLRAMGFMARRVGRDINPNPDDVMIEGQFIIIDKGNRFTRNVIGFGIGSTETVAQVQVLRARAYNPKKQLLFDFRAVSKGSKKPGIVIPVAMAATAVTVVSGAVGLVGEVKGPVTQDAIRMADAIAGELGSFFVEQGWIAQEALEE